jgi:hypothetical protein
MFWHRKKFGDREDKENLLNILTQAEPGLTATT